MALPPPVQVRQGYEALNRLNEDHKCKDAEDAIKKKWQQFLKEDLELFEEVQRCGLCPTDVSSSLTLRGMNAGTSLRTMGVQRGRCPRKEGNVMLLPPCDRQTAKRKQKAKGTEEWIADEEGMEWMHGLNGMYGQLVSTSPPEDELDDV